MSPNRPVAPILDRLLFLPGEAGDPDQRFTKSLFVFVLLASFLAQSFLVLASLFSGFPQVTLAYLLLDVLIVVGLVFLRSRFSPWLYTGGILMVAWTTAILSMLMGQGTGALLWNLLLPTGVLLLKGERWGWAILGLDFLFALCHMAFGLSGLSLGMLVGWQAATLFLFLTFLVFLRLIRLTLDTYQAEKGHTLDQLSLTKDSEARWADQARFLETLMDVIPFPLFHKGNDGLYLSANSAFRVVFDVQKETVNGSRNNDFLLPENAKTLAKIELDLMARDSMAVEETVLVHADGHPHNFIVYLMPFIDEDQVHLGSIGVLIDITDRKDREEKLVQLNNTKDQLFSIISHDLRGPVGKLKQLLDIYMDDPGIFDKATWDQVFHDMRRSADSLFQLLENLLSWARSQQGEAQIRFESVALDPIVGDIFSVFKLLATEKKITLDMDLRLQGPILTDRHVLSTVLRNLVHNALKFTPQGGKVTVTAEENVDDLWIEVRDTGVGMSEDTIHRIFGKKERLTTWGTAKEKGQGIGLGLCQQLAASIGAHLEVESTLGMGTVLRLHLPTPEL